MPIIPNDTVSSILNLVNRANPVSVVKHPLSHSAFTLDSSGIIGFFGDESAFRAMSTVILGSSCRWFGWYNSPGSYEVAKQFSRLATSHLFDAMFPIDDKDFAKTFMVDGLVGPEYTSLYCPTVAGPSRMGHLGSLFARKIFQVLRTKDNMDTRVIFIKLRRLVKNDEQHSSSESNIFVIGTRIISIGGCIACAVVADWFCLQVASIAISIIASGVASFTIGSCRLNLSYDIRSGSDTVGDILLRTDRDIIVLLRNVDVMCYLTNRGFCLNIKRSDDVDSMKKSSRDYKRETLMILWKYLVDISVFILLSQFLVQLLLIPQGTLFGQLMFIGTLVVSWVYHSYLSSLSLDLQTKALFKTLSIDYEENICQHLFSTRIEAAVFACLAFRSIHLLRLKLDKENMGEESQSPDDERRERAEKEAERVDTAINTLLSALLSGEKIAEQAFRQSLVRKMSRSAMIDYARDNDLSFEFGHRRDTVVQTPSGEIRTFIRDMPELAQYQTEAENTLRRWRSEFWEKEEMQRLAGLYD